jgi:DnaJ-class molecular chaperone
MLALVTVIALVGPGRLEAKTCPKCKGSGQVLSTCAMCKGSGKSNTGNTCQGCGGSGQRYKFCGSCDGKGTVPDNPLHTAPGH